MNKVSIIVPIYNASKYLSICVDSIVAQTYRNIEIIVVDDKSTDKSVALLKKYKQKFKNFKLITLKKNQGVSHARNVGIEAATGDYFFFIDSDDFIDKDTINKMVKVAKEYNADVVDIERIMWYKRESKILTFMETKKLKDNMILGSVSKDLRSVTWPRYVTGKLYKKSVIGDVRFDENVRCYEDALFNHQIKANFTNYIYAKDIFYNYLQRPLSLINTISINHMDYAYIGKKIQETYQSHKYYKDDIKRVVDNIIIKDILVILILKIPKMKLSKMRKEKCVKDFIELAHELSISDMGTIYRIAIALFKNRIFLSFYFALASHLNLIDLGFRVLAFVHPYKMGDAPLKKKIALLYKKMN